MTMERQNATDRFIELHGLLLGAVLDGRDIGTVICPATEATLSTRP